MEPAGHARVERRLAIFAPRSKRSLLGQARRVSSRRSTAVSLFRATKFPAAMPAASDVCNTKYLIIKGFLWK